MMGGFHRKKWLGIAQRYQSLSTEEQVRVQRRMTDWAKLTPDERRQARDKYKSLQNASPEKKESVKLKWREYKELPETEKTRLNAEATQKPAPRPVPAKHLLTPLPQGVPASPASVAPADPAVAR
jgi:hypothetical protein